jgi:universal stress protein A
MKAYKHILIATDFTNCSEMAAKRAVDLARRFKARLTLLHVIEHFPDYMPVELVPPEDVDPTQYVTERCQERLEQLARHTRYSNAKSLVRMTLDSTKREIVRVAKEINADLIITGTHGYRGLSALLGSVAEGVAHLAQCEVMIVRSQTGIGPSS